LGVHQRANRPETQKALPGMIGRLSGVRMSIPVILDNKEPDAPSVFEPDALLREARRQKALSLAEVPALCVLDPDGDIVRRLRNSGQAASCLSRISTATTADYPGGERADCAPRSQRCLLLGVKRTSCRPTATSAHNRERC